MLFFISFHPEPSTALFNIFKVQNYEEIKFHTYRGTFCVFGLRVWFQNTLLLSDKKTWLSNTYRLCQGAKTSPSLINIDMPARTKVMATHWGMVKAICRPLLPMLPKRRQFTISYETTKANDLCVTSLNTPSLVIALFHHETC